MVLQNYVILGQGVPARLHFTAHSIGPRDITDPQTGRPGTRNVLEFDVDRLDGKAVNAKFSTMAETLASQFSAFLPDKRYTLYDFIITKRGAGFQTKYTVERIPLAGAPR